MHTYKIGDIVQITDWGSTHSGYRTFIEAHAPELIAFWRRNASPGIDTHHCVRYIGDEQYGSGNYIAILQDVLTQQVYVVNSAGFEYVADGASFKLEETTTKPYKHPDASTFEDIYK